MIRPHLHQLKNTAFGKRIQSRSRHIQPPPSLLPPLSISHLSLLFAPCSRCRILKKYPDFDASAQMEFYGAGSGGMDGQGGMGPGMHGQLQGGGAVSAVSTLGGGVYDGAGIGGPGGYPTSSSPPPLLSPTSRQLGPAIGPVGGGFPHHPAAYGETPLSSDLGLSALNQSLSALSVSGGQQQGPGSTGESGGGGVGSPFYSTFPPESNGSSGVSTVGGGGSHQSQGSSLFSP